MRISSADRVMQTMARYFDVEAQETGKAGPAAEAARRASADPECLDALNQVLEEVGRRRSLGAYADVSRDDSACPECLGALTQLLEAGRRRGSFRACTAVSREDSGVDAVAWLPDSTGCGTGKAYALQAKIFDAAGSDPEVHSYLALVLVAAIHLDRSSLGTPDARSARREPSAIDIAAVRTALRRLADGQKLPPAALQRELPEQQEPEHPRPGPDQLRASTLAEFTAALAQFRVKAGMPAYREMSRRSRPGASPSTLLAVVHGERLPSLRAVSAFVTGCGGSAEELSRFTAAWQRIRLSDSPGIPGSGPLGDGTCPYAPVIDAGTSGCRSGGGNSTV